MSTAINWQVRKGSPLLTHPTYLKWSKLNFAAMDANTIKADLIICLGSNEAAELIAYLSWLLRIKTMLG